MIPPAKPQKNAETIQPIILYFIVSIPIASALSSLSRDNEDKACLLYTSDAADDA